MDSGKRAYQVIEILKKLIILCTAFFMLSSCISKKKYNQRLTQKHSPEELKKDLGIIKTSLEEAHPGVYWYISKEKLDEDFKSVAHQFTDSLNSLNFYRKVAPLVSEIKCGHTRLVHPGLKLNRVQRDSLKKKGNPPLTQLDYKIEGDKLFVRSVKSKYLSSFKPGIEIITIDSIPAKEIINETEKLFSSDGYNPTFYDEVLNKSFANYYKLAYPKRDSSFLILKDSSGLCGTWIKAERPVIKKVKILPREEKRKTREKKEFQKKNRYKGLDEEQNPLLDFKIESNLKGTGILTVKSFSFPDNNFHRFFRETFKIIAKNNIKNIILDLRDNGGGNLMNCNLLFRYLYNKPNKFTGRADMSARYFTTAKYADHFIINDLRGFYPLLLVHKDSFGYYSKLPTDRFKKPKNKVYNGNLIVLTNGYSFSATALLASNLQQVNRGIFIGEETGGGFNQCTAGRIPYLTLPNTGLKLRLPLKVIKPANQRELKGRGVFPNVEVKNRIEDVIEGKDKVLDKAMEMLKRQN